MRLDFLMLAFKLSKNSRKPLSFFSPPFLSFAGAKVLHFPLPPTTIFIIFQYFYILSEYQRDKFHAFCNNCCRKAVFLRKMRLPGAFRGPERDVFRAFPAGIRARFMAFMPFQGGSGRTRLGTFFWRAPYYIYVRDGLPGGCAWRDVPGGTLPAGCVCRMRMADVPDGCACRDAAWRMCLTGRCHARLRRTWLPR